MANKQLLEISLFKLNKHTSLNYVQLFLHPTTREKAEELERTKLGITMDKPDSDDDDIVGGDPFRALDINTLRAKV